MEDEYEKVDCGWSDALMMLPPAPVFLLGVGGDEEMDVTTIGMFNVFSLFPIILGVGVTTSRYTYRLLRQNEGFTLNVPGHELLEAVKTCGERSGKDTAKFEECGLTPAPGKRVRAPKVRECLLNLEVKRTDQKRIGDHEWFLGEIAHADHVIGYDPADALVYWGGEFRAVGAVLDSLV
ncbi:MAG: flavin reductase family protein [Methanomassiliicoccales archaeon]